MGGEAFEIDSAEASLRVVPGEGGRVQSIVDGVSGREVLMQRVGEPGPRLDFLASCTGGWDELFPNDSAWGDYPDHGLVWTLPFAVTSGFDRGVTLQASIDAPAVTLTRTLTLLAPPRRGVRAVMTLAAEEATGPFLWAAHPMLGVREGWRVELPASATNFEADPDLPGRYEGGGTLTREAWEQHSDIPAVSSGVAEVIYVDGVDEATVRSADGSAVTRVSWDAGFLRHLWLVVITGAYGLDDCLLIEPCTTRPYRLEDAVPAGTAPSLGAGEDVTWWVEVESLDPVDAP